VFSYRRCKVRGEHVDRLGVLKGCGAHVVVQRLHLQHADYHNQLGWDASWQTQSSAQVSSAQP